MDKQSSQVEKGKNGEGRKEEKKAGDVRLEAAEDPGPTMMLRIRHRGKHEAGERAERETDEKRRF